MSAWSWVYWLLNPPQNLSISMILAISFMLGLLHGATPDEHTWPITFSYAVGKYSTKGGMKAGFLFSAGFTAQRALLSTLGFLGLAYFYQKYNLDGPVYIVVGIVMAIAGAMILNRGVYKHVHLIPSRVHTEKAERVNPEAAIGDVPLWMTPIHGLIAGFGFGAYATVVTFILAPRMPSILYAPLPGLMFGLGTMAMQIIFGALFGRAARVKGLNEQDVARLGRLTAGRTLYYGGIAFSLVGALIVLFPSIDAFAIRTGVPIPNLDAVDVGLLLVITVVGAIGIGSMIKAYREISRLTAARVSPGSNSAPK